MAGLVLELKWQTDGLRREAFGVLWLLQTKLGDRPFTETSQVDSVPGSITVEWPIDDVSDGDQLQKQVAEILDASGWGRQGTVLVQLGHD